MSIMGINLPVFDMKVFQHHISAAIHKPTRLMQISDLHLGNLKNPLKKLAKIYEIYLRYRPDLVITTGDILGHPSPTTSFPEEQVGWLLTSLDNMFSTAELVGYVEGNHDLVGDNRYYLRRYMKSSVDLTNRSVKIRERSLSITGFVDLTKDKNPLIELTGGPYYNLLVAHNPETFLNAFQRDNFSNTKPFLAISGHTHGGEITSNHKLAKFIGKVLPKYRRVYKYPNYMAGLFEPEPARYLYINRGIYTHFLRVLVPTEITIMDILPFNHPRLKT